MNCCVIGDPIAHSLSPQIHQGLMAQDGIRGSYTAIKVNKETLPFFMKSARALYNGFNVTMPLKEAIVPLLDGLDKSVTAAVNTVVIQNGKAIGYNTDGLGFIDALPFDAVGKKVYMLGYGGAGKEICAALEEKGASVQVILRHTKQKKGSLHWLALQESILDCDLLINATPLGMEDKGNFEDFSFLRRMPRHATVFDLVYLPQGQTKLIEHAKAAGLRAIGGEALLLAQAKRSYLLFKEATL